MRAKLSIAFSALAAIVWAVPLAGTAPFLARASMSIDRPTVSLPAPVRFTTDRDRGLLVRVWLNGTGPYAFAVDTGAGFNLVTERVAAAARLSVRTVRPTILGGLTTARTTSNREAVIQELALGNQANRFASGKTAVVVSRLDSGVDGILDPTDVYSPLAYSIDIPNGRLEAFESSGSVIENAAERAVVPWVQADDTGRPFVRLGDGRLALVDTGSNFALAVNGRGAVIVSRARDRKNSLPTRDIGGGSIQSRRVAPTTVSIGELVLQRIPTDVLFGIEDDAPVILGRAALYPFKIIFDPRRHLIEFISVER